MVIAVPDSYRSYIGDDAVRRAVDHLLAESGKSKRAVLPPDFEWKDLPSFHRAVLSAHQIRCEYAIFLIGVWDAVWGWTLQGADPEVPVELAGAADSHLHSPIDASTVWDTGWFYRSFLVGDGRSWLAVGSSDQDGTAVGLWTSDGPHASALGPKWEVGSTEDDGHYSEQVAWSEAGQVDVKPLREAAADALRAIAVESVA